MYTNENNNMKDTRNHINQQNLNDVARRANEEKNKKREAKKRRQMAPYRRACERAARQGKFSMPFRAGYSIFHKVSALDFQCYFSMDRNFVIDTRSKKGHVVIRWDEESVNNRYGF